jgi:hypothetical protein
MATFAKLVMVIVGGAVGATLMAEWAYDSFFYRPPSRSAVLETMYEEKMPLHPTEGYRLVGMAIGAAAGLFVARFIAPSNTTPPKA